MSSTQEQVLGMFDSYNETAEEALEALDSGDEYEDQDADEFLDNWVLSLDKSVVVDVMLTVGGPVAYIHCECSADGYGTLGIDRASFIAAWGSDRLETPLSSRDALWRVAERYVEGMEG